MASESALSNTPRVHFSLAELFTPSTHKMSAASVLNALGRFLPIDYQKGVVTSRTANCPPCPVPKYKIGQFAEGGVVIWLTEDGQHGLVAAITDAVGSSVTYTWGPSTELGNGARNNQSLPFSTPNTPYGEYYGGYKNQKFIEGAYPVAIFEFPAFEAAKDYTYTPTGGPNYADWWLPSSRELSLMYSIQDKINQVSTDNGGTPLREIRYWSSRDAGMLDAWFLDFSNGNQGNISKDSRYAVRCVRAF